MKKFIQKDGKLYCSDCNKEMKITNGFVFCEFCESSIEEILHQKECKNTNKED